MSGSAKAGTTADRHQMRAEDLDREVRALASAPGHVCFSLTEDLHDCRSAVGPILRRYCQQRCAASVPADALRGSSVIVLRSVVHKRIHSVQFVQRLVGEVEGENRCGNSLKISGAPALGVRGCPDSTLPKSSMCLEIMVSAAGLEPATHALKGHCSTN